MTRKEFYKIVGEYPEDVLGEDWENEIEEFITGDNEYFHDGHLRGSCYACKMD